MYQILMNNLRFLSLLLLLVSSGSQAIAQFPKGRQFSRAAVVCAHPEAAKVGEEVLKNGGNAADAAFAVHLRWLWFIHLPVIWEAADLHFGAIIKDQTISWISGKQHGQSQTQHVSG